MIKAKLVKPFIKSQQMIFPNRPGNPMYWTSVQTNLKMSIKWLTKIFINFLKLCSKTIILVIEEIILLISLIIKCLKVCKNFIVTNKLTIIQLICVLFMICNGLLLILDYLKFDYELRLIISKNDRGIDLPAIDICTESNVLFDKRKILKHFDLDRHYSLIEHKLKLHNYCSYYCRPKYQQFYYQSLLFYFNSLKECCNNYSQYIHARLKLFIEKFEQMIFAHLSYEQMISLTLSGQELFECRASVHLKNQTIGSNQTIIDNCFQVFPISRHIYVNNDFGICYKLFDNNNQIILSKIMT